MSDDQSSPQAFGHIPEEYFSECDEHLAEAHRGVLELRGSLGQPSIDRSVLDDLFRSFHSIKGLSAMVGVREAEQLAHVLESFLGSLRKGATTLQAEGYDALISGVKAIEEIVEARRQASRSPDISQLAARLAALTPKAAVSSLERASHLPIDPAAISLSPSEREAITRALAAGSAVCCFGFAPTPALANQGIDVNAVRKALESLGRIVHASPQVNRSGQVAFAFIVITDAADEDLQRGLHEGIVEIRFELPTSVAAEDIGSRPTAAGGKSRSRSNLVRVDLGKLDDLMRMVGELVITRGRFEQDLRQFSRETPQRAYRTFAETNGKFERQIRDLREAVMRVRMVPIREVFSRMHFIVHDLARGTDKSVIIELSGEETEVDKLIVERIMDPLLHLVRNAVSHGLETAAERTARGKEASGRLSLRARAAGESVVIEVEDDGRGIDLQGVQARALSAGLLTPGAELDNATLLDIICTPEFSTQDEADRVSGRGVGMAAVRAAVSEFGGALEVHTSPGRGTCFTIRLPLTMAITDALIVSAGGEKYAIAQASVREILRLERSDVTAIEGNELAVNRGKSLPLVRLARFFDLPEANRDVLYVLVVGDERSSAGLVVDAVLRIHEIVIRPLTDRLVRRPGISGATELGDRKAVLILDAKELLSEVTGKFRATSRAGSETVSAGSPRGGGETMR